MMHPMNRMRVEAWSTKVYTETILNEYGPVASLDLLLDALTEDMNDRKKEKETFGICRYDSSEDSSYDARPAESSDILHSENLQLSGSSYERSLNVGFSKEKLPALQYIYPPNGIELAPIHKATDVNWKDIDVTEYTGMGSGSSSGSLKRKRDRNDDSACESSLNWRSESLPNLIDSSSSPPKLVARLHAVPPSKRRRRTTILEKQDQASNLHTRYPRGHPYLHGVKAILEGHEKVSWDDSMDAFIFGWQWLMEDRDMVESMPTGLAGGSSMRF